MGKSRFARIGPGGQICHCRDFDLNHFKSEETDLPYLVI